MKFWWMKDKKVEDLPWNQPHRTYWHQYSSNIQPLLLKLFSTVESEHSVKSARKKSQLTSELVSMRPSTRVSMWEGGQNIWYSTWSISAAPVLETNNLSQFQGFCSHLLDPDLQEWKMWNSVGGFPGLALWTCNQYSTNRHATFCLQTILSSFYIYIYTWFEKE